MKNRQGNETHIMRYDDQSGLRLTLHFDLDKDPLRQYQAQLEIVHFIPGDTLEVFNIPMNAEAISALSDTLADWADLLDIGEWEQVQR